MGTELCERFSFYGLRSILITFLTGQLGRSPSTAESVFHMFTAGCYLMPLAGAYIADRYLGRYRTILFFSLFYCLGHGTIAAFDNLAVSAGWLSDTRAQQCFTTQAFDLVCITAKPQLQESSPLIHT